MPSSQIRELLPVEYPENLRNISDPPARLWLRGSLPSQDTKLLTVIGSRALSRYGKEACEMLIAGLTGYPISIVSGLALGADACAHAMALKAGLHTIAIPGSGLNDDVIGPRSNVSLAKEILNRGGALLSENEPNHVAYAGDFPSRNRIMVGLADAVLMIEAGDKSGSLISAKYAGEYNRELLCVPHRIGDPHGRGAETFLRIGATLVTKSEHILEALRIEHRKQASISPQNLSTLSSTERLLYEYLTEPKDRDSMIRQHADIPSHTILTALMSLELKGVIHEQFGHWRRV